ncbi:unnamed protein product [Tilletia laevis]|nr:unnamed protein product [Tilletia caries]CAD6909707.1 unnamed protein product [Tilletia laevis]
MRTRRAPAPDDLLTTRSGSTRAAASSAQPSKKRKTPAVAAAATTPSRSHTRVTSTRTPLATKNAHSSSQPSSTGLLQAGSDLLLANAFSQSQQDDNDKDEDEPIKKKSKTSDLPAPSKKSATRPSLVDLVDDALKPIDEDEAPVRTSKPTRPTEVRKTHAAQAQRQPSVSSTASGSLKTTSVASLLSSRRVGSRGKVKKTVAATGFYAQAAPPPPLPRATRPTALVATKPASKSSNLATTSKRTLLESPERRTGASTALAATGAKPTRKPLQTIAPELVPIPQAAASQTRTNSTSGSVSLFSLQPTLGKRRRGMVIWDDSDDEEDDDAEEEDEDEDEKDAQDVDDDFSDNGKKGDAEKDMVRSSPGSSDKENRDPLASQTSASRTAVGTARKIIAPLAAPPPPPPPASAPKGVHHTPKRSTEDARSKLTRTPLTILPDIGPSHSTPLSGKNEAKTISNKDKGKAVMRDEHPEAPSLSTTTAKSQPSNSSSSASSSGALLTGPVANARELSSSIPASDDVFLYAKPSDVVGAADLLLASPAHQEEDVDLRVEEEEAEEEEEEEVDVALEDHDEVIRDLGLEPDVPVLEDFGMDDIPDAAQDYMQWPSQAGESPDADLPPHPAAPAEDDDALSDFGDSEDEVGPGKVSFDQENDPFGFFAAEAKLRARREEEQLRRSSAAAESKDDNEEEEEEGELEETGGEVYGLNLRTEKKAFASSSPVPSDDENEEDDVEDAHPTSKKADISGDPADSSIATTGADDSQSPVRRSARAQKKQAVVELSDSEESEDRVPPKHKTTKAKKAQRVEDEKHSDDPYDTDLPPPGFVRSAAEVRRRIGAGGGGMRNGRAPADFVDEPFDSDDERLPSRSTSGSSGGSTGPKGKGKGAQVKEARLSDLVKLLPKRASAATYGSNKKGKTKGRVVSSATATAAAAKTSSSSSPKRRERPSSGSVSSLPSPRAVLDRRSNKKRAVDVSDDDDEEDEEDVFSADSGDDEPAAKKTKTSTASSRSKAGASSAAAKQAKSASGTTKKAGALPEWCNEKKKPTTTTATATQQKGRTVSGRKRRRGEDQDEEEKDGEDSDSSLSGIESELEDEEEEAVEVKTGGRRAKLAKTTAKVAVTSKGKAKAATKEVGTAKKTTVSGKKRVPSKTQIERPKDDLDDFELESELVI